VRKAAALALAGLTLAGTVALTGCDPGPPCDQWSTMWMPHTHTVGKVTYTSVDPVSICVHYAPETTKHGS
jgi:hypothetical protein